LNKKGLDSCDESEQFSKNFLKIMSYLLISIVLCFVAVTFAQGDVTDEVGSIAMRECKKVIKEKKVVADTVWHFSKTLCSDIQAAAETYVDEQV
jgi:hypothetical protein